MFEKELLSASPAEIYQIENRRNRVHMLQFVLNVALYFYLILSPLHLFFVPGNAGYMMSGVALSTVICYYFIRQVFRKKQSFSDLWILVMQNVVLGLGAINNFTHMIITQDILQTTNVMFIPLVMAILGMGRNNFLVWLVVVNVAWGLFLFSIDFAPKSEIIHFSFGMLISSTIGCAMNAARASLVKSSAEQMVLRLNAERKVVAANKKLQKMALYDSLTGLANRRSLETFFTAAWKRANAGKSPMSLLVCDIDRFKLYNDTYGHQAGDHALCMVADVLQSCVRETSDLVCRYGGEEFVIVIPQLSNDKVEAVANRMRQEVSKRTRGRMGITVSIGVVTAVPNEEVNFKLLFGMADKALYQAKVQGRDQVVSVLMT